MTWKTHSEDFLDFYFQLHPSLKSGDLVNLAKTQRKGTKMPKCTEKEAHKGWDENQRVAHLVPEDLRFPRLYLCGLNLHRRS